jgi:preprotein translocase subunit YajC
MGARQSKRSVDITTTPKKGDDVVVEGEGKVEKIAEIDAKVTTNGAIHTEIEYADKDETATNEEAETADIKENGTSESEDAKTPEGDTTAAGDQLNESAATVSEKSPESGDVKTEETPENKKNKDKSKKKKWSFRSISFSKKDKSKPNKDSEKNGDVKEVAEEVSPIDLQLLRCPFTNTVDEFPVSRRDSDAISCRPFRSDNQKLDFSIWRRRVVGLGKPHR